MPSKSKYDMDAEDIIRAYGAEAVIVAVIGGSSGHGCCVKLAANSPAEAAELNDKLVHYLRLQADAMDAQSKMFRGGKP